MNNVTNKREPNSYARDIKPQGHIYVFADPGLPNEYKIGQSGREVEIRRAELSKETSRPRSLVELYRRVTLSPPKDTETDVHNALKSLGYWIENSDKRSNEWFTGDFEQIVRTIDQVVNINNATTLFTSNPTEADTIMRELYVASGTSFHPGLVLDSAFFNLCVSAYEGTASIVDTNWAIHAAKVKITDADRKGEFCFLLAEHSRLVLENFDEYILYLESAIHSPWIHSKNEQKCRDVLIDIYSSGAREDFHRVMELLKGSSNITHKIQYAYTIGNGVRFLAKSDPDAALSYIQSSLRWNDGYRDVLRYIFTAEKLNSDRDQCQIDFSQYQFNCKVIPPALSYWYLDDADQKKADSLSKSPFGEVLHNVFSDGLYQAHPEKASVDKIEAYYIVACSLLRHDFEFYFLSAYDDLMILQLRQDIGMAINLLEIAASKGHRRAIEALCYQYTNGPESIRCSERTQHYRQMIPQSIDDTHLKFPCYGISLLNEQ